MICDVLSVVMLLLLLLMMVVLMLMMMLMLIEASLNWPLRSVRFPFCSRAQSSSLLYWPSLCEASPSLSPQKGAAMLQFTLRSNAVPKG